MEGTLIHDLPPEQSAYSQIGALMITYNVFLVVP